MNKALFLLSSAFSIGTSLHALEPSSPKPNHMVTLVSNDGKAIQLPKNAAHISPVLKNLTEDVVENHQIPLPNIDGPTLDIIVRILTDISTIQTKQLSGTLPKEQSVIRPDGKLISKNTLPIIAQYVPGKDAAQYLLAFEYLGIEILSYNLCWLFVAEQLKKTPHISLHNVELLTKKHVSSWFIDYARRCYQLQKAGAHYELSIADYIALNGIPPIKPYLGINAINLDHLRITDLEGIAALGTVRTLDADKKPIDVVINEITVVNNFILYVQPKTFDGLAHLNRLLLDGNQINLIVPRSFQGLTNLDTLSLTRNKLTKLAPRTFQGLDNLTALHLSLNKLDIQPGAFRGLNSLQTLTLSDNEITSLNLRALRGLPNLQALSLNSNKLRTLEPGTLQGLTNLRRLYLQNNKFSTINEHMFQDLARLEILGLHQNDIETLEQNAFGDLRNLQTLNLHINKLTALPPEILENLRNLVQLDLSDNKITALSAGNFQNLANLHELSVRNNHLTTLITGVFRGLTQLQDLDLSRNRISVIQPQVFAEQGNLTNLELSNNRIDACTQETFQGLTSLTDLVLGANPLAPEHLAPETFRGLNNLQRISLPTDTFESLGTDAIRERYGLGANIEIDM